MKIKSHDKQFFVLEDGTRIAKSGLRPSTLARMQQSFAQGGEVQRHADGGEQAQAPTSTDFPVPTEAPVQGSDVGDFVRGVRNFFLPPGGGQQLDPRAVQQAEAERAQPQASPANAQEADTIDMPTEQSAAPEAGHETPPHDVGANGRAISSTSGAAGPAHAARAAAPTRAAAAPRNPMMDAIDTAQYLALSGAETDAQSKAAQAKANELATDAYIQQQQAIQEKYTKQFEDNQSRAEQVRQSILDNPIDANRLWNNASVAGQMSALVGMAMGATAGAMSGRGGNQVADMVNKVIDRDLASQEANLGTKMNLLNYHMQNGNQIQQARQLAKADALTMFGSQLEANAYKSAPGQIQAQALQQAANIMTQAQQLRLNVAETGAKVEMLRANTQKTYTENATAALELGFLKGGLSPNASPQQKAYVNMHFYGKDLMGAQTPLGTVIDPDVRQKVTKMVPALRQGNAALDRLTGAGGAQGELGLSNLIPGAPSRGASQQDLDTLKEAMAATSEVGGKGALKFANVPSLAEAQTPAGQAKLRAIRDELHARATNLMQQAQSSSGTFGQ